MEIPKIIDLLRDNADYQLISGFVTSSYGINIRTLSSLIGVLKMQYSEELERIKLVLSQNDSLWSSIRKNWHMSIVKSILPPDAVQRGGDRVSPKARGRQQQAIIRMAEERAKTAAPTVPEQVIVEEIMATVRDRWSLATDCTIVIERVLQLVVRRSRTPHSDDDDDITEDDTKDLMETFDKQELVERIVDGETNKPMRFIASCFQQIPEDLRTAEVVIGVLNVLNTQAQTVKINAESQKIYAESERLQAEAKLVSSQLEPERLNAEANLKGVQQEPQRLKAETDRLKAETDRLKAETDRIKAETKKIVVERKPTTKRIHEEDLQCVWNGLESLSLAVWQSKPVIKSEMSKQMVYDAVLQRAKENLRRFRVRILASSTGQDSDTASTLKLVYVPADVDVKSWAAAFWDEMTETRTTTCETTATMLNAASNAITHPKSMRQIRLPHGSSDLVAALAGAYDENTESGIEMTPERIKRLDEKFVRNAHMARTWAVLWPSSRPKNPSVIPTFIDILRDPIITELREWLRRSDADNDNDDVPPPAYPANLNADMRPVELVPCELQALPINTVLPMLQRAGVARAFNARILAAYEATADRADDIEAAHPPCQERLRQWRRLSDDATCDGELTFKQIVECLGYQTVERECRNVQVLTAVLVALRQNNIPSSAWYFKRGASNVWKFRVCLPEMRLAAIFVSRLLLGGADIRFLAKDILHVSQGPNFVAAPMTKTVS